MASNNLYQLKIEIANTKPIVWRRILVPDNITFHELNATIQIAFDWCGYHMYSFELGDLSISNFEDDLGIKENIDSEKTKLSKYLSDDLKFKYIYDFGDYWVHKIKVEKVVDNIDNIKEPKCIKANMAPLPEDVGGPYGYLRFLSIINNKKDSEYKDMKEWAEGTCYIEDRNFVDIDEINEMLTDFKEHAKFLKGENEFF